MSTLLTSRSEFNRDPRRPGRCRASAETVQTISRARRGKPLLRPHRQELIPRVSMLPAFRHWFTGIMSVDVSNLRPPARTDTSSWLGEGLSVRPAVRSRFEHLNPRSLRFSSLGRSLPQPLPRAVSSHVTKWRSRRSSPPSRSLRQRHQHQRNQQPSGCIRIGEGGGRSPYASVRKSPRSQPPSDPRPSQGRHKCSETENSGQQKLASLSIEAPAHPDHHRHLCQ